MMTELQEQVPQDDQGAIKDLVFKKIFKDLVLVTANLDTVLLIFKSMSAPPLMERVSASY